MTTTTTTTDWPRCASTFTMGGKPLDCTLPRGHEMDGAEHHHSTDGTHWTVALTYADGHRVRL